MDDKLEGTHSRLACSYDSLTIHSVYDTVGVPLCEHKTQNKETFIEEKQGHPKTPTAPTFFFSSGLRPVAAVSSAKIATRFANSPTISCTNQTVRKSASLLARQVWYYAPLRHNVPSIGTKSFFFFSWTKRERRETQKQSFISNRFCNITSEIFLQC
jgi:hypothetical protein